MLMIFTGAGKKRRLKPAGAPGKNLLMKLNELKKNIAAAKSAASGLLDLTSRQRKNVLLSLARLIKSQTKKIIQANKNDIMAARRNGKTDSFIERLSLDEKKINSIAETATIIAKSKDNLFETIRRYRRPSGLMIKKVRYPLGLIAIIYESRPNVTIDAFILTFKSGNAVLLRGGKEIRGTNAILVKLIKQALKTEKINVKIVQDYSGLARGLSFELMQNKNIDCLIPRGGKELIDSVVLNAKIPIIITGASVVHTYVDADANIGLAGKIILNAKTRRVSICNALDVVLLHRLIYKKALKVMAQDLAEKNVGIRADRLSYKLLGSLGYPKLKKVKSRDFDTEFLDYILAVKVVNNFSEAITHISRHSLGHSEAIITRSKKQAQQFFHHIDAACLYLNTSTQFSDGGEFGMGSEIGISTQKLHARGPFAAAELTTYKYLVESNGATRE